jgi:hypothetical protein
MRFWKKPTPEQVERAISLLAYVEHHRYFFDRLENPEWLEPLWEQGFFKHPPEPVRNEEEGAVRFPPWPEARYLARMAKHKPELVCRIMREMSDTKNATVHVDLANAALAMPPEISAQLVEKVVKWAETPYFVLPEKLGELIAHWARGGKTEEALRVARVLLDVLPDEQRRTPGPKDSYALRPEPQARFDVWEYQEILQKHYPELARAAGIPALEALCDLLERAIRLSRRRDDDEGPEDYSYIWRPAVEDHPQNLGHTLKDALVVSVRDAVEEVIRSDKVTVKKVVEILESRRWKIFHRIALHILRVFSEQAADLVAARLTDSGLFEDNGMRYEYVLLLRATCPRLPEQDQRTILEWIDKGPEVEWFKEWRLKETGTPLSEDELARYRELWQRDRLAWIGLEHLPADWQERYRNLVAKHGEPEHPEFPAYRGTVWVGPDSPKTPEELQAMSVEEIAVFLKTWKPPENVLREPSPEGLGRTLSSVVAEDPDRFAVEAERFQDLDPTYVRALFSGLRDGLKQQKVFDWQPVLRLCQWVVDQPREIPGRKVDYLEADPDWGWTRKAIAELLLTGLESESGEIPIELRDEVWKVLRPLTDDSDPTPEHEERYGGSNMDPAELSINTVRGRAMHTVISYALWIRRHFENQADVKELLARGFDEMQEVREVLDTHLDISQDPSLAVRSVYGQWFPWLTLLDRTWAEHRKDRIFPTNEQSQAYFDAAWNAYITFCQPYDDVFNLLRDIYGHAAKRIGVHDASTRWIRNPDESLAEHLMIFYWRGNIKLEDTLFVLFWQNAPDALRAYAIKFIGHVLQQTEDAVPTKIINRLQKLCDERLSLAKKAPQEHKKEISAFGLWFVSGKFDTTWSIGRLLEGLRLIPKLEPDDMVIEHLAQTVETHPKESVQALRSIAEGDRKGWCIYGNQDHIRQILQVGLQSPDASQEAEAAIHYLGSRGFLEYRDLLKY